MTSKRCTKCGETKDIDSFNKHAAYAGGYQTWCKRCVMKNTASYIRKKKSGVTKEQYNAAFNEQEGRCLVCGRHRSEQKRDLHADHNHKTGAFRGLLCGRCNVGLGYFLDDRNLLLKAIEYLDKTDG